MPAPAPADAITIRNLTRSVLMFEAERGGVLVLGDCADTDDKVPAVGRDPKLQPSPTVVLDRAEWAEVLPSARAVIREYVARGLFEAEGDLSEPAA